MENNDITVAHESEASLAAAAAAGATPKAKAKAAVRPPPGGPEGPGGGGFGDDGPGGNPPDGEGTGNDRVAQFRRVSGLPANATEADKNAELKLNPLPSTGTGIQKWVASVEQALIATTQYQDLMFE